MATSLSDRIPDVNLNTSVLRAEGLRSLNPGQYRVVMMVEKLVAE